jgi:hypothetical protein
MAGSREQKNTQANGMPTWLQGFLACGRQSSSTKPRQKSIKTDAVLGLNRTPVTPSIDRGIGLILRTLNVKINCEQTDVGRGGTASATPYLR